MFEKGRKVKRTKDSFFLAGGRRGGATNIENRAKVERGKTPEAEKGSSS